MNSGRTLKRLSGLLVLAVVTTGCDGKWSRGGWPSPVTEQGQKVLGVWRGSLITAGCVGAFVIGLILWSCVAFRRRDPDEMPRQVRYNLPIEVLYTVVPVVIVSILFYFTAIRENDEDKFSVHPDVNIQVVGFQWAWQFNYLDPGAQVTVTGRPARYPQLVLPVGETVRFYETSADVIHAWWVVPFLFKRDVVPGKPNSFEVTLTHTGTFAGKCTELCGIDHDRMLFSVRVVSPTDYNAWLTQTKAIAASGTDPMFTTYTGAGASTFAGTKTAQRSH
ncbi:MAG TPA: cytochrome c oxidase subunit II [Mycobacteriales bacterium]|nr:cytochrome c oxidase subunit II [Mycobacteriales bacterium]